MAGRSLIFGILFVAAFVALIVSIAWIDKTQPLHQPDPLSADRTQPVPPSSAQ